MLCRDTQSLDQSHLLLYVLNAVRFRKCCTVMTQQLILQGREMRKYSMPAAQARRSAGITADYLEAVEAESDYEDDSLTASDRARRSLLSRDRLDEQAEVRTCAACLIICMTAILYHFCRNKQSQVAIQLQYTQHVATRLVSN